MKKYRRSRRRNPTLAVTGGSVLTGALVIAAIVAGIMVYRNRDKILSWGKTAFNPTSDKNLAYSGVNKVVQSVTGDPNASLGSKIADWLKPSAEKKVDQMLAPIPGADLMNRSYYDLGAKPKLVTEHGVLVDSSYRDALRGTDDAPEYPDGDGHE